MEPKGPLRFVSVIIDPLLIIWRSVIGSLGIDGVCHIIAWEFSLKNWRNPASPRDKSYLSILGARFSHVTRWLWWTPIDNHHFLYHHFKEKVFELFPRIVSKLLVGQLHPRSLTTRPWKMVVGRLPCKFLHVWLTNSFRWSLLVFSFPSKSHHQDYVFRPADFYQASFATIPGKGDNPIYNLTTIHTLFNRL